MPSLIHPLWAANLAVDMKHFHEQFETPMTFQYLSCHGFVLDSTRYACERSINFKGRAITALPDHPLP